MKEKCMSILYNKIQWYYEDEDGNIIENSIDHIIQQLQKLEETNIITEEEYNYILTNGLYNFVEDDYHHIVKRPTTPLQALSNICMRCRDVDICLNSEDGTMCEDHNILFNTLFKEPFYKDAIEQIEKVIKSISDLPGSNKK